MVSYNVAAAVDNANHSAGKQCWFASMSLWVTALGYNVPHLIRVNYFTVQLISFVHD
jgi:hypothetical protein